MALPEFSMRQLLEAGIHFGHQQHRWNPKMGPYIFGVRNKIHILDLAQTVPMLHQALKAVSDTVAGGGRVLVVGTKRQAQAPVADAAKRSAQYYVNARWLGGMLTNWKTISNSINRLKTLEETMAAESSGLTKKERLNQQREYETLDRNLGGIKDMGGIPDLLFVIDTNKESIAIQEAQRLNIPVAAVLDSNSDPAGITYPIPGNDDASRAIDLYCDLIARAALDGISRSQGAMGVDIGASAEVPMAEPALEEAAEEVAEAAPEAVAEEAPAAAAVAEVAVEAEAPAAEAEAAEAEAADDAPIFTAPEGEPDDLKQISGVGPVLEKKLNSLGITKFAQIRDFSAEDIVRVDDVLNFKGRIERDGWIEQAAELAK